MSGADFRIRARNFVNTRQGYRKVKTTARRTVRQVRYLNPRIARPVALDQSEQRRRMRRVQPDAAMRRRTAEPRQIIGAVNGEAITRAPCDPSSKAWPREIKQLRLARLILRC
jgi:hypothetical protein